MTRVSAAGEESRRPTVAPRARRGEAVLRPESPLARGPSWRGDLRRDREMRGADGRFRKRGAPSGDGCQRGGLDSNGRAPGALRRRRSVRVPRCILVIVTGADLSPGCARWFSCASGMRGWPCSKYTAKTVRLAARVGGADARMRSFPRKRRRRSSALSRFAVQHAAPTTQQRRLKSSACERLR